MNPRYTIDVFDLADWLIKKGQEEKVSISHKKLQKLLYYIKHWSLYEDQSSDLGVRPPDGLLIDADFEAWVHGAVCRQVFNQYRQYGFDDLTKINGILNSRQPEIDSKVEAFLKAVWDKYKNCSADQLERLNHQDKSWINQRSNLNKDTLTDRKISENDMKKYAPNIPR